MSKSRAPPEQSPSLDGEQPLGILIVDDDVTFRTELGELLQGSGYAVSLAADRAEALERLRTDDVDVVLLDLVLSGPTGLEILREGLAVDPTITFIVVTGHGTPELRVEAIRAGASDFLAKPFEFDALERLLQVQSEKLRVRQQQATRGGATSPPLREKD